MYSDMFNETGKRIYRNLMTIAAILIILIIIPSISIFLGMSFNTSQSIARNKLDRSISAGRIYIDSIMSTTENLAGNSVIVQTLDGTRTGSLTSVLDSARTYSLYINAITVYAADGAYYTSSGVTNPPSLDALAAREDIGDFIADGDAEEYISLRTSGIIKAYDGTPYDERSGIISCCRKVYSGDGVVGYIFADVFPESLFEYFSFTGDKLLSGSVAILSFDGGSFASAGLASTDKYIAAHNGSIVGNFMVISNMRNFYGATVRMVVPLRQMILNSLAVCGAILLAGAAMMIATHFVAAATSRYVTGRLDRLLNKMTLSSERLTGRQP